MKRYSKPPKLKGWDFSQLKVTEQGPTIEYTDLIKSLLNGHKTLLDIGTGGGEKFAQFASKAKLAIAIDVDPTMVKTAAQNLCEKHLNNTHLILCGAEKLPIATSTIDVTTDRHAPFSPKEVARILRPEGVFITQQVSEGDKQNIKRIFKRGQHYGQKTGTKKRKYIKKLKQAGLNIIKHRTVNTTEYYKTIQGIIFLLAHTPTIPYFDLKKEQDKLEQIEQRLMTKKGIKTNSKRYLIIATKSSGDA